MIKRTVLFVALGFLFSKSMMAQAKVGETEITKKNSWFKAGINAGLPIGNAADVSSVTAGIDLKGQLMMTRHWGIGLTGCYNHFFGKSGFKSFGTIPLGGFVRYYFSNEGLFGGADGGYSFLTNANGAKGGPFVRPQIGYHNYDWNIYVFYSHVLRSEANGGALQYAGVGFTYNVRFK